MRRMDLHEIEARGDAAAGRLDEGDHHILNAGGIERDRLGVSLEGHGRG